MSNKLSDWITNELNSRGWSMNELARRSGLAHVTILDILSGQARPGLKFCKGVAAALDVRDVDVLRLAGLIDPLPPSDTPTDREMMQAFAELDTKDKETILELAQALNAKRRKGGGKTRP